MPFKFHQPHRHRVPKVKYRVTNWAEYERGLVNRGDIRFWISQEAIEAWQAPYRKAPGGQMRFSNVAIETTLMLGALLRLPLRQSEGFLRSLMELMQLCLPVPDHSTLAQNAKPRRPARSIGAGHAFDRVRPFALKVRLPDADIQPKTLNSSIPPRA